MKVEGRKVTGLRGLTYGSGTAETTIQHLVGICAWWIISQAHHAQVHAFTGPV